jgi:hypothetical protein
MTKAATKRKAGADTRQTRPRATTIELELRHSEVGSLLLSRFTRAQIVEYSTKKWGVDYAQADQYIASAKQLIAERIKETKNTTIDDHVDALLDLKRRARDEKDLRIELDVSKEIAKLTALYPVETKRLELSNVSDTDLIEQTNELAARILAEGAGDGTPKIDEAV